MRDLLFYLGFGIILCSSNQIILTKVLEIEPGIHFYFLHAYLFAGFTGIHFFLINKKKSKGSAFVTAFMGATTVKLLVSMMVIFLYIYLDKENAKHLAISFASAYLLYTFFSLSMLYGKIRQS